MVGPLWLSWTWTCRYRSCRAIGFSAITCEQLQVRLDFKNCLLGNTLPPTHTIQLYYLVPFSSSPSCRKQRKVKPQQQRMKKTKQSNLSDKEQRKQSNQTSAAKNKENKAIKPQRQRTKKTKQSNLSGKEQRKQSNQTSAACLSARLARCSPSAATTRPRASRAAFL